MAVVVTQGGVWSGVIGVSLKLGEALSKPRNRPQIQTEKESAMFVEEGKEVEKQSSQEEKEEKPRASGGFNGAHAARRRRKSG